MTEYTSFLNLIPAAVIIATLAFFARFFGKVIEDQNPFSDDQEWSIELGGILFLMSMGFGFVGISLASHYPWGLRSHWLHIVTITVLIFILGSQYVNSIYEGSKVFNINSESTNKIEEKFNGLGKKYAAISVFLGISILSVIVFYFGTLEFLSKNIYWLSLTCLVIFFIFILAAMNFSYKRLKNIVLVEIFFSDPLRKTFECKNSQGQQG